MYLKLKQTFILGYLVFANGPLIVGLKKYLAAIRDFFLLAIKGFSIIRLQ